ncbi:MAG: exodeoxyribonuclease VII large subunit [Thermoleophilaceae bacterium]
MTEPLPGFQPAGIEGYPGPFAVGRYARDLQVKLRTFTDVCLIGEAVNVRATGARRTNVYFELRDGDGAVPCAMWSNEFERAGVELRDGMQVVVAGGCDYYPGGAKASPSFAFRVKELRPAGEGDLLARLERLRRKLSEEGLFEPQKRLARTVLPRRIGVVTAEGGAAKRDLLAGLHRRGWEGTIIWGHAPVQDRRAAPAIGTALRDLAALAAVDVIVVTRGGGSIADLWAFCDETLCRTVAMLPVPVIAAVGHEVDRTLIDDVAAVSCSTPTHAAEEAVGVDCAAARATLRRDAARLDRCGRVAVVGGARRLQGFTRAPRHQLERHRRHLHQKARELRAAGRRGVADRAERLAPASRAAALERLGRSLADRRAEALASHAARLSALDPERTLERGYALALGADGEPLTTVDALRGAGRFDLRVSDGEAPARLEDSSP